jgi:AcrR family transcriptional regulator
MAAKRTRRSGVPASAQDKESPNTRGRRQELNDAAVEIFHERGYAGTSVEDIADRLGILKGSLYYYISSKENLLFEIVSEVHADVQRIIEETLGHEEYPPLERLANYIRAQVEYNAKNVTRIAVYYQDIRQLSPDRLKEIRKRRRSQDRIIIALIEQAQADGDIDADIDAALIAHCVFGTIIWNYTWYNLRSSITPAALADFCVEYALRGITGAHVPALASQT